MNNENVEICTDQNSDDEDDLTAPFYEYEAFDSIWQALQWKQIRTRVPICMKKTLRSRYMLANVIYLVYTIGILIVDFNPYLNGTANDDNSNSTINLGLDEPVGNVPLANHLFVVFAVIHLITAFLYWWSWKDRSWLDIIMIPEYLNHIEGGLYLWSAIWYSREDTLGSYYTLAVHKIELTAAIIELFASVGWIISWHMTYVRTIGRGFTFDDPDTMAWLTTVISSIIYLVYYVQINVDPLQYNTNWLYTYGDIVYFIGACYFICAALRDDNWFWFLPFAGQYRIASGKVQVESTRRLPMHGKPAILITTPCKPCVRRRRIEKTQENRETNFLTSYIQLNRF